MILKLRLGSLRVPTSKTWAAFSDDLSNDLSNDRVDRMIFLPEAQKKILSSPVADLINSAGGTGGMGSAVGGYYIWAQVADVPDVKWLHIDLAGPTKNFGLSGRQTGFGVGLMGRLAYKMAQKGQAAPKL